MKRRPDAITEHHHPPGVQTEMLLILLPLPLADQDKGIISPAFGGLAERLDGGLVVGVLTPEEQARLGAQGGA